MELHNNNNHDKYSETIGSRLSDYERNVLLDTLRNIWHNYLQATDEFDVKQHWLQLFLFNFQFVDVALLEAAEFKSFLNPIPEEICSYLLEQIYEIISKSDLYAPAQLDLNISEIDRDPGIRDKQAPEKNKQFLQLLRKNHNFAQLILGTPSDCSKIVALRQFLTHQLGQHLLLFLLKVDIKLVASQKSLCNLCINLFPNCSWSGGEECVELPKPRTIFHFVGNLNYYQKPRSKQYSWLSKFANLNASGEHRSQSFDIATKDVKPTLEDFQTAVKTSDEIALLLIHLLTKCIANECETTLTEQSMSVTALNFSLDCLRQEDSAFSSPHNANTIKCQLLSLIEQCLNNLFASADDRLHAIQFQCIFAKLVAALESNQSHTALLYALIFIVFGILHNVVAIYSSNPQLCNSKHNLYTLKFIDESVMDGCVGSIVKLLQETPVTDDETQAVFVSVYRTLLRIIDDLSKYDRLAISSNGSASSNGSLQHRPHRRRRSKTQQMHCHNQVPRLSCFFQGVLLNLLPHLPVNLQEQSMLYLLRAGTCCCHYTVTTYRTCLTVALHISVYYQKCVYRFLNVKVLSTLFARSPPDQQTKRLQHTACAKCDARLKSSDFHMGILQLYREFYTKLMERNNVVSLCLYLKHLKHISHLLTNGIASGILAEIVLPIYRDFKARMTRFQAGNTTSPTATPKLGRTSDREPPVTTSPHRSPNRPFLQVSSKIIYRSPAAGEEEETLKVLHECLSIFVMYLYDIRLIKAFYIEENIQHLEDLLAEPRLIRSICDLIKIGIDNITFLGDNSQEQIALSRRLITLQLNSSDRAAQLFTALLARLAKTSRRRRAQFWFEGPALSETTDPCNSNLSPQDILHIAAFQWSLNYELLKTSQYFYNEFAKIYSIVVEDEELEEEEQEGQEEEGEGERERTQSKRNEVRIKSCLRHGDKTIIDILRLNYNALSSFLMLPRRKSTPRKSSCQQTTGADSTRNDYFSDSLENLFAKMSVDRLARASLSIGPTTTPPPLLVSSYYSDGSRHNVYEHITQYYSSDFDQQHTFLERLRERQSANELLLFSESNIVLLFDIRNQGDSPKDSVTAKVAEANGNAGNATTNDVTTTATATTCNTTDREAHHASVGNEGIIVRIFQMFGSLFGGSRTNSLSHLEPRVAASDEEDEVEEDLLCLYEPHSDCKKLLLKLFEATMAICIKGYQNEEVEKMQKHLRKLKAIVLSSASSDWEQHAAEHTRENLVIQTLQTLLKIAELSNTFNEPAAVVNSGNIVATATDDPTALMDLRPRTNSFNSTRVGGGVSCNYHKRQRALLAVKNHVTTPTTPPQRPISGDSCDADYFSTRASLVCADSELELSENDNEDFYLTADEGYEADEEIPEASETEGISDTAEMWNCLQPSSRYRTHILHGGLCRLVVEILTELSHKCTRNPNGWCDSLAQLVNRLFVIREYLGGALFLLRGFAPVLECNDVRLRELQQCILELIVNLNTPEVLSTFFSILSSKSPPVDILLKYMNHICANSIKKAQPSVELEFPVPIDGKCISTTEIPIAEQIDRVRNYHLQCQASTPFTRSPCVIPITHARLWNNDGFTLSLWLHAKGSQTHKCSSQLVEDDSRSSSDFSLKTHIFSVGTNQAMLSVYINNNMNLVFETCKPNAEIPTRSPQVQEDSFDGNNLAHPAFTQASEIKPKSKVAPKMANGNNISDTNNSSSLGGLTTSNTACSAFPATTTPSTFRNALKHTKLAFLNSFSNMHLFNGHNEDDSYFESSYEDLKHFRMTKNKWTHFTFAVVVLTDHLNLTIFIDGLEQHVINLPFRRVRDLTRTHLFQMISLGDGAVSRLHNTSNCTESRSTLDSYPMRLSLSNLMLFNRKISSKETIINLTAMGPDFIELTQCQVANWKPNYGYLNLSKLHCANFGNFLESMRVLREARVLRYTAQQPDLVMCYDSSSNTELEGTACGRPCGLILYGELVQNELQSLQTATILCGGLSNLLYLFARVVEISTNSATQAMALDFLLNVALSESHLFTEFHRNDYISLIGFVIKTERCTKDVHLLRSIVNNACSQPLINKKGEHLHVNDNTTASLVYPRLLVSVLHRYSDWQRSGVEHSDILDMLFKCILALTREKHPHRDFNVEQLNKAGLMKELLNLCKIYVIESPNPVYVSKVAAEGFVDIISVFAGSPPSPSLMDEIMKLLLLLHKPSECYITHDRSKFYFLLSAQLPTKERSALSSATSFGRVAAPFRRNPTQRRPGVAVPLNISHSTTVANNTADAARTARINRLRKLHTRSSAYRRALSELEETLENVADCSRLNKSALRLVNPVEADRWRSKFKRSASIHLPASSSKYMCPPNTSRHVRSALFVRHSSSRKIRRKRFSLKAANSTRSLTSAGRRSESSLHSMTSAAAASYSVGHGDDSVLDEVFEPYPTIQQRRLRTLVKTDTYSSLGLTTLQGGLLTLLKDFLCLLPDNAIDDVLHHYIKVEFLLVLSNHCSPMVRTAIIRLLAALTSRLTQQDILMCAKNLYPQHLANQLSMYLPDVAMFKACIEWVSGAYGDLDTMLTHESLRIQNRFGLNALLAIASKSTASSPQNDFAEKAFRVLKRLFMKDVDEQPAMIEAGLLQCCVKALHNLYKASNTFNSEAEDSISDLLTFIGEISLKSVGHINLIWDIINMLVFYQEKQPANIVRGFRSVQAKLQLNWISMFFIRGSVPNCNFKVQALPNCSLSLTETRTRLDLLINRCTQFFTVFDANCSASVNEIRLFELLVSYGISTNQRCNNFIAWGLQPSRPRDLRAFIVNALWTACQNESLPTIICDGKLIKALLWLCLLEDLDRPIPNLPLLCRRLGINENDSTWNLENELGRIELYCCTETVKQKSLLEKTIYRFEALAQNCIESSMVTTRRVAELQNAERKLIMNHMKDYDDTYAYTKWLNIVRHMTHEGAPWYSKQRSENSWELDDTEGPSRVHTRLRRCHLDIDKRFIMTDYQYSDSVDLTTSYSDYARPLDYLISSYDQQLNISLNSQILYNFPAKYLPVDGEIDGEIIVTDHKLYFLATYRCKYFYVNCDISNITEIWLKRHQHQEKAFEIFLDTNQSLFFSLQNRDDWKIMRDVFCDKIVTPPDQSKILQITQQWREGLLTNWEYLMTLNQISGRTYNDLMQYPVFPWVLSNYTSDFLDLTEVQNFRKLSKPIAVQNEENEQHYINNYTYIENTMTNMGSLILKPYHYSSHYSNSGTVLHFLVRVPPFTSYFLRYQDNNFDLPDRTFHALSTTWSLASRDSPTDVKELIPEFFSLPEMFENFERFNFGCRQSGERVEDVTLPPWCLRDPRLFVLIHRQALESELVRNNLHHWIDLIFGFKQIGEHAVDAINVFHPATYAVFLESEITDPIERKAVETMVKTYGQMPRQLFKSPHPASKAFNYCLTDDKPILSSVRGLRWGVYLGSPQLPKATLGNIYKLPGADYLLSFNNTNVVYGLPAHAAVMQGAETDTYNVISWGYDDRIVRIQPLNKMYTKPKNLLHNSSFDDITACGCDPNSNQLWFGHKSGRLSVYKCTGVEAGQRSGKFRQSYARGLRLSYNSAFRKITSKSVVKPADADVDGDATIPSISPPTAADAASQRDGADLCWSGPTVLMRHTDEITCISLSVEFKIVVSAGKDGLAVIWDLNNWSYVRTIERPAEIHHSPITQLTISPTLGDIVTVHTLPWQSSTDNNSNSNSNSNNVNDNVDSSAAAADECFEVTEENLDDFVNVSINPNGKSILRLHSVNARYVQHIVHEDRILAVCYSYIKEGVGVNVIATAVEGGIVRLWSSWNLSFITEIITGLSDIKSLTYSTHQHLVVLTKESHIQIWETEGLYGNSPKFPQIAYK